MDKEIPSNMAAPTVLITGASAGIGAALAHCFAADGYHCLLTGRNQARLQAVATTLQNQYNVTVECYCVELSDSTALNRFIEEIKSRHPRLDILVNNAGNGVAGAFVKTPQDREVNCLLTNINALTLLCKAFLPAMVQAGQGKILNVASTAAFLPGPYMAVYYASKAYVLSFSEAINNEVKNHGISVSTLCPGMTKTEFHARANMLGLNIMKNPTMNAEHVARIGYRGLLKNKAVIVPGIMNKIMIKLARLLPRACVFPVIRHFQKPSS